VLGILERGKKGESRVRVKVVPTTRKKALQSELRNHVLAGSAIFTDSLKSYEGLDEFQHEVVDHAVEYVKGEVVHTNGLENFWSLLKRSLKGTYVAVEPFHLFRYLDEQAFRYNNRNGMTDADRFDLAVSQIVGRRIMYKELTGKTPQAAEETNSLLALEEQGSRLSGQEELFVNRRRGSRAAPVRLDFVQITLASLKVCRSDRRA